MRQYDAEPQAIKIPNTIPAFKAWGTFRKGGGKTARGRGTRS